MIVIGYIIIQIIYNVGIRDYLIACMGAIWLQPGRLSDMKCTVMIWRSWVQAPTGWTCGAWYFCPKSYLNQTYQLPVHQSIWEPVHLKSPQTSKIMWQHISFLEVTDGLVVITGVSVTWNVLSWSGGHEFKPQSGWTWGAWYFCPKSYLIQKLKKDRELLKTRESTDELWLGLLTE